MMLKSPQAVHFTKVEALTSPIIDETRYEFNECAGWQWLQRLCFAVLDWIGANYQTSTTFFVRETAANDKLITDALGNQGRWIERLVDGQKLRLVLGPDEFPDLMKLMNFQNWRPTYMDGKILISTQFSRDGEVYTIPITVVPWMRGALLIPEE